MTNHTLLNYQNTLGILINTPIIIESQVQTMWTLLIVMIKSWMNSLSHRISKYMIGIILTMIDNLVQPQVVNRHLAKSVRVQHREKRHQQQLHEPKLSHLIMNSPMISQLAQIIWMRCARSYKVFSQERHIWRKRSKSTNRASI